VNPREKAESMRVARYSTVFGYYGEDAKFRLDRDSQDIETPPWLNLHDNGWADFQFRRLSHVTTSTGDGVRVEGSAEMTVTARGGAELIHTQPCVEDIWAGELLMPPERWEGLNTHAWGRPFIVDHSPGLVWDYRLEGKFYSYWGVEFSHDYLYAPYVVANVFSFIVPSPGQQVGSCWMRYTADRMVDKAKVRFDYKAFAPNPIAE